jgi:hypothetical protein
VVIGKGKIRPPQTGMKKFYGYRFINDGNELKQNLLKRLKALNKGHLIVFFVWQGYLLTKR